jgi:hypothetical protein
MTHETHMSVVGEGDLNPVAIHLIYKTVIETSNPRQVTRTEIHMRIGEGHDIWVTPRGAKLGA